MDVVSTQKQLAQIQLAFMNGISYDPVMQSYIEKPISDQPMVNIVDLMAAAQRYMHNSFGTKLIILCSTK